MFQPMPGESFAGPLPALTARQAEIEARLLQHVRTLAVPRNLSNYARLEETRAYLLEHLSGYSVRQQAYEAEGHAFYNLETRCDGPFVVVGAHYDSVLDCPGANDNASGVAAVLELARLLQGVPGLRFVLFANEEPPFYRTQDMGSARYVQQISPEVRAMVCLETVGYYTDQPGSQQSPFPGVPDVGDFVCIVGNCESTGLVQQLLGAWRSAPVPFPSLGLAPMDFAEPFLFEAGMGMSDHLNFWAAGIPAVMVTDTVFYRYEHYHELTDTWDKLTYEPFARMVDGLAQALARVVPVIVA
jgi:hypothetical protein